MWVTVWIARYEPSTPKRPRPHRAGIVANRIGPQPLPAWSPTSTRDVSGSLHRPTLRSRSQHPGNPEKLPLAFDVGDRESHRTVSGLYRTWTLAQWRSRWECGTNELCNSIVIQITLNRYRRRQTNLAGGPCRSDPTSPPPASIPCERSMECILATHEAVDTRRYRTPHTASHRCRCLIIRSHARVDGHQLTVGHRGDRRRDIRRPHRGSCDAPTFSMTHARRRRPRGVPFHVDG